MTAGPLDITKAYARTARGQVHYAEAGEGAPILLMGETPRGWRSFERLIPLLARHRRVIAIDLAEVVARIPARTLVLEFTTPEEAHFGAQGPRLSGLMPSATTASIPVSFLAALERQPAAIAHTVLNFLKDGT